MATKLHTITKGSCTLIGLHEKISDITFLTCLGHPWQHKTEYIISISVTWPSQVRKVLSHHNITDILLKTLQM
jgi:hypothetical protein